MRETNSVFKPLINMSFLRIALTLHLLLKDDNLCINRIYVLSFIFRNYLEEESEML